VSGVHREDGVELEADGPRLDAVHARSQQRGEQIRIGETAANTRADRLEQWLARRVLDQSHQWISG
jgi:hypothetical protein